MNPLINLTHIAKTYNYRHIFQPVSFTVRAGEAWHIQGINGSGKSTILKIIAGLCSYDGECKVNASLGYIGHKSGLYGQLTAIENMQYLTNWHTAYTNIEKGLSKLKEWQIPIYKTLDQLSAGQQQACALLSLYNLNKQCWLLDEATQCLDANLTSLWFNICKHHLQNNGIIIFTSHINNDLMLDLATNNLKLERFKC